jgi:tripartite-type tricarboxylate transporter receptor subunit TctC
MKRALAFALVAAACASQAWAQAYPTRVVRMLVGYPAGGSVGCTPEQFGGDAPIGVS